MKVDFLKYQAQTSSSPLSLEVSRAKGSYIYDTAGKKYLDFIAGVSVNNLGHNHPEIVKAVKRQLEDYMHVMVYGEFVQKPQADLCKALAATLPEPLSVVYLTNSGTEATEGALKLAKRYTQRTEIISTKNSYHGNTQGAMSVSGAEQQNSAFRPLIPGVRFMEYNNESDIDKITSKTAAVILETIQGGAGFIVPKNEYLKKVKERCHEVGALFILDEIQTGIGRTGTFWGFENYHITPDIIITGKGLGGGMPIGAFIANHDMMSILKENPKLGHITTFGGHPVVAAAGLVALREITQSNLIAETLGKEQLIRSLLHHPLIKEIRGKGLMLAMIAETSKIATEIVYRCLEEGLLLFFLLFDSTAVRITPPLTISDDEIRNGCAIINKVLHAIENNL
ncbi:MAG: aminotransferase class III-fold pyridoxal phosphate-dependent enzyme [Flavobacteriaceae bacterium]|nr:MAG: aminotransferase class III-fold pyridoxal phosphate-dependent enzyme [Flavobacteriaceae bacterium]